MPTKFLQRARSIFAATNPPDVVSLDVPLLIRLLEYAREDAKSDMDLHRLTQKLIEKSAEGNTLSMGDYESLIP